MTEPLSPKQAEEIGLLIEDRVRKAVSDLSVTHIKEAADRAFPDKEIPYFTQLKKQLLGPVAVSAVLMAMASFTTQCTLDAVKNREARKEKQRSEYVEIFQSYRSAHRDRWVNGSLLNSALRWGLPFDVVSKRKSDYDSAYVVTNRVFPSARDYIDRVVVPDDLTDEKVFKKYFDADLRKVTSVHDHCLTVAFAVRNDWESALLADRAKKSPSESLKDLKSARDNAVFDSLERCDYRGTIYRHGTVSRIYNNCADAIFNELSFAIERDIKGNASKYYEWKEKADMAIHGQCSLTDALVKAETKKDEAAGVQQVAPAEVPTSGASPPRLGRS
jgi:hypothetical protein